MYTIESAMIATSHDLMQQPSPRGGDDAASILLRNGMQDRGAFEVSTRQFRNFDGRYDHCDIWLWLLGREVVFTRPMRLRIESVKTSPGRKDQSCTGAVP